MTDVYAFEDKPHHYLPDVVGTLADGKPFIAEAGMEDDKRGDRNLAKAEAARRLAACNRAPLDDSNRPDQPSFDELVETVAGLCECLLTPNAGANLAAGKAMMRRKIEEVQAQVTERSNQ